MAAAVILMVVLGVVVLVGTNLYLRSWVRTESSAEAHLHDPRTHTLAYVLPNGVDPAVIKFELGRAGLETGAGHVGGDECLLVECEPAQRERVRALIQHAQAVRYAGSALKLDQVVFEDER